MNDDLQCLESSLSLKVLPQSEKQMLQQNTARLGLNSFQHCHSAAINLTALYCVSNFEIFYLNGFLEFKKVYLFHHYNICLLQRQNIHTLEVGKNKHN